MNNKTYKKINEAGEFSRSKVQIHSTAPVDLDALRACDGSWSVFCRRVPFLKFVWILVLGFWCFSTPAQTNTNAQPPKVSPKAAEPRRVDVNEFEKLWQDKNNMVLDVRTSKEFTAGHIPGAINLDVNSPDFGEKISGLSKDKVYLVHCAAGVRSARACQKMNSLGFEHLIDLAPGFKGWQQAGKPVEK